MSDVEVGKTVIKIDPEHKEEILRLKGYVMYLTGEPLSLSEVCYLASRVMLRLIDLYNNEEGVLQMIHEEIVDVVEDLKNMKGSDKTKQ